MHTTRLKRIYYQEVSAQFESPRISPEDANRRVRLYLSQAPHPDSLAGRRGRLFGGEHDGEPQAYEVRHFLEILSRIPSDADLVVLSEHSAACRHLETLRNLATANRQVIVSALGFSRSGDAAFNTVAVALPDVEPVVLQKVSFSAEDQQQAQDGKLLRGDRLTVFDTTIGRFAVLNCHEYTHSHLLHVLCTKSIDFLVVTSFNPAWQLYGEYAIADIHRLFCFVVLCNVGNYGGTGVYAPFSRLGTGDGAVSTGGVLFASRGPSRAETAIDLPVGELRKLRDFRKNGDAFAVFKTPAEHYQRIIPPETILIEQPPFRQAIQKIDTIDLPSLGYDRGTRQGRPARIAVAQLHSPPMDVYLNNSYCISRSKEGKQLADAIRRRLKAKELKGADFLVMPEVFSPLELDEDYAKFAQKNRTIIITGMEYDPQPPGIVYGSAHATGVNRCFIYVPTDKGVKRIEYRKLTRSQYDALYRDGASGASGALCRFHMDLGNRLLRFVHPDLGSFGVLICYDYSHSEIVHAINIVGRSEPLHMLFVVCHNPYEELYRSCCLADCHRYYQFVILSNVAIYGGSGVFAPMRTKGQARTLLFAGRGTEGIFLQDIDIQGLMWARQANDAELSSKHQKRPESFQRRPGIFNVQWEITVES